MRLAGRLLPGGQLELLHATHEPFKAFLGRDTLDQLAEQEQQAFLALLNSDIAAMTAQCGDKAPACRPIMKEGGVRPVIRNQIADSKPDLVILGTHGRTGPAHALLGSVAEDLLSDAPVDVLAVKAH